MGLTKNLGWLSKYITADSSGNVSLGTTSTARPLTIRSAHANATATTFTGALLIHDEPSGVSPHLGIGVAYNSGYHHSWIQSNNTDGTYPLSINPAGGNVGVGNTNPSRKLEVSSDGSNWISGTFSGTGGTNKAVIGNLNTPTIGGHNAALNAWSDFTVGGVNINFAPYGNTAVRVLDTGGVKFFDGTLSGTGGFELTSEAGFGARFQSGNYRFMAANNSSEYLRISSTGNVSIGTQTDNGYKLSVNGSISAASLNLAGNYEASVNTDSNWTSYQTLIPTGTFPAFGTYMISVWWHYGNGSNQPYYYNCAFLWVTCSTNGNGTDVETTPIGATHTGGTGVNISFRSIAAVGSSTGLQARLNNFPNANGFITVRATRMQGF